MCNKIINVQLYAYVIADVYRMYTSQLQHEGGVANGHICSLLHSSVLHGGMLCIAAMATSLCSSCVG